MTNQSRIIEKLEDVTAILVLGAGLLALVLGFDKWWAILALGWFVLVPLVDEGGDLILEWMARDRTNDSSAPNRDRPEALTTLRDRYARGEIDELEFERRLERLLDTETMDAVEKYAENEIEYESSER